MVPTAVILFVLTSVILCMLRAAISLCMVERKGKESLNEEVEWRPLYGGAPGEEV